MRLSKQWRPVGFAAAISLSLAAFLQPAQAQTTEPAPGPLDQLAGLEAPADIDVAALRQQVLERVQTKADAAPLRRPQIAPQLLKLPHFDFDVVFDPDSALVRPPSYQMIGRIADALSDLKLAPYTFLVIDHTESGGRRDANLTLSQRRADSIRQILAGVFKISPRRLQALGLGEEQLLDAARPTSPANARAQIVAIGLVPVADSSQATAPANRGPARKRR